MLLFALVSCGGSEDNPHAPECTEHADNNADGKCDTCGTAMKAPECTEHIDADGDGKCDVCGDATEATGIQIPLISSEEAKFRFVVANTLSGSARMEIALLTENLSEFGIETEVVFESTPSENICEILVGDVTSRGKKYEFDKYSLGKKGYIIKGIDNKIIINAGSEELMGEVIGIFASEILGITGGIDRLRDVTFTSSSDLIKIQDDYKITSLTVGGKSLVGKNIAVDKRNTLHLSASNYLQDIIYTYTGIYLPIVALEGTEESSIVIRRTPDDGEFGFNVYTDGDTLKIDCAFDKRIQEGVTAFMEDIIINGEGIINIDSSFRFSKDIRTVRYEDFGAKGDGRTDDAEAIRKTH